MSEQEVTAEATEAPEVTPVSAEIDGSPPPIDATPPPPPKEEPIAGKMAALLRREQAFQARSRSERDKHEADRQANARERADLDAIKARYAKIQTDPLEGLKEVGLSYEELTQRILSDGKPSPEHQYAQLKAELDELRAERKRETDAKESQSITERIESGKKTFEEHIFADEATYPYLTLYPPEEVRESAWKIATEYYQKTGEPPDQKELAEFLEQRAADQYKIEVSRTQRLAARQSQGKPSEERAENGKGTEAKAAQGTRTLTNGLAAERAAPELPKNINTLSSAEQDKVFAEFLNKNLWRE